MKAEIIKIMEGAPTPESGRRDCAAIVGDLVAIGIAGVGDEVGVIIGVDMVDIGVGVGKIVGVGEGRRNGVGVAVDGGGTGVEVGFSDAGTSANSS